MSPRPLSPEHALFEPALEQARTGRLDEALETLAAAMEPRAGREQRRKAAAAAYAEVARMAQAGGNLATAERALDEALRLAPRFADLHYQQACLLLLRQQRGGARAALGEALRINPRYLAARLELALLDAREGLLAESLTALRALEQESRVEEPQAFQRGLQSLGRAEWDEASALLRSALRISDPTVERIVRDHRGLMAAGEHARALQGLRAAVDAHPGYPDLHYLLGCCELESGMTDDAIASLARALELHPDFHSARVQFARALETLGDLSQAGEQVALVLRDDPGHPQALELEARWSRRREARGRHPAKPLEGA